MSVSYAKAEYAKVEVTGDETENGFSLPTAIPMLSVVAPANLPEGYTFQAKVESGKTFTVVVVSAVPLLACLLACCCYRDFYTVEVTSACTTHLFQFPSSSCHPNTCCFFFFIVASRWCRRGTIFHGPMRLSF